MAIGLEDGNVLVHDTQLGVHVCRLPRHRAAVRCVAWHRQQYVVSGSDDELLHLCDIGPPPAVPGAAAGAETDGGSGAGAIAGTVAGGSASEALGSRRRPRMVALRDDSSSALLSAACFSDVPIGMVCAADGCVRLYDLVSGIKVGDVATSGDGAWVVARGGVQPGAATACSTLRRHCLCPSSLCCPMKQPLR